MRRYLAMQAVEAGNPSNGAAYANGMFLSPECNSKVGKFDLYLIRSNLGIRLTPFSFLPQ